MVVPKNRYGIELILNFTKKQKSILLLMKNKIARTKFEGATTYVFFINYCSGLVFLKIFSYIISLLNYFGP